MNRQSVAALSGDPQHASQVQWLVNRDLFPEALGTVLIRVLPGGAELPSHQLAMAESVTFLLSGGGEWSANDGPWSLSAGEGVFNPAGTRRAFTATFGKDATLLEVWGHPSNPGVASHSVNSDTGSGCRISHVVDKDDDILQTTGGFIDMGVHWLATTETVGASTLVLATSTFTPGGSHQLHRHTDADEFFLIIEGCGTLLTEQGSERLKAGEVVYLAAGEWHGFTTDPGVTTRSVYGYLGVGNLKQAGYEVREGVA